MTEVQGGGGVGVRRWAEAGALAVLVLVLGFAGGDWARWRLLGGPVGTVEVTRMVVAPLKGNREEYYADGVEAVRCSRSALPWGGMDACWWRERRKVVLER